MCPGLEWLEHSFGISSYSLIGYLEHFSEIREKKLLEAFAMYSENQSRRPLNPLLGVVFGLLLLGVGIFLGIDFQKAYTKAYTDPEAQCKIVSKSILEFQEGTDPTMYQTSFSLYVQPKNGQKAFEAKSNGHVQDVQEGDKSTVESFLNRYVVGKSYTCWYDPNAHSSVILNRSLDSPSAWFLPLAAFVAILLGSIMLIVSLVKVLRVFFLLLGFVGLLARRKQG
jgi:hypothetical protein